MVRRPLDPEVEAALLLVLTVADDECVDVTDCTPQQAKAFSNQTRVPGCRYYGKARAQIRGTTVTLFPIRGTL